MSWKSLPATMNDWSPEQLLAVHEFCQLMAETIWHHHGEQLIEHWRDDIRDQGELCPTTPVGDNLPLPFDDDLNF